MFEDPIISPSLLSADFMSMGRDVDELVAAGTDWLHVDVMDGHFVPNLTMGVPFVAALRKRSDLPLDVHLMIDNPLDQLPWYLECDPDYVTVHLESLESDADVYTALDLIRDAGVRCGLSIKPDCNIDLLVPYLADVDMVLVMSVFPGFSGQSFIEGSDARVAAVVSRCREVGASPLIQVDGGISTSTVGCVAAAGADVFVAGNAVFGAEDRGAAMQAIREAARSARHAREDAVSR